ncbi:MAG: hypothetical protein ACLP6W_23970 [Bryobacteraceae bacterium]
MKPTLPFALLALLFGPPLANCQLYAVNAPFDSSAYAPLDGPQRFQRWLSEDGTSPAIHLHALVVSTITQAMDEPPQWGRTTGGFARRVRGEYSGTFIANSVHDTLAAALGTDPRYFRCACTGLFRRTGHAMEMTFLTYNRDGHKTLDLPQLTGQYGSEMVSTLWLPSHYSPLVQGLQAGHMEMGLIGALHIVQEFYPELKRFFHVRNSLIASVVQR